MAYMHDNDKKQQSHPRAKIDLPIVDRLLDVTNPKDVDLCEIARLYLRYQRFPGEQKLKSKIIRVVENWGYNPFDMESLFKVTREIYSNNPNPFGDSIKPKGSKNFDSKQNESGKIDWS